MSQARARYGGESLQVAVAAIEAGVLLREHAVADGCGGGGSDGSGGGSGPTRAAGAAGAAAAAGAAEAVAAARAEAEALLRTALATQRARRAAIQARGCTLERATRDRAARGDEHTERGLAALSDLLLENGEWAEVRCMLLRVPVPVPVPMAMHVYVHVHVRVHAHVHVHVHVHLHVLLCMCMCMCMCARCACAGVSAATCARRAAGSEGGQGNGAAVVAFLAGRGCARHQRCTGAVGGP